MTRVAQAAQAVQQTIDQHPGVNWIIILGSAALAWLQPIASVIAIVWGLLQIYLAVEKRWGCPFKRFFSKGKSK